ncbi:Alkylated DNA repair dioxygenase AlkB [Mesorhizobium albiziae]|uniref:Alkylated DNA repair dioxygenase AlkB n=1 Tax=Neomesorhizobium albiziae TaxID=335020 RepID=A0A1I4D0B2_9HYPH|nr:alpha-ketoglutarate-dependent dioxygenase AlkB [Mesorhizobium albiziae]GLS28359.1 2OG-Fe(II) oxygenase [Mesorhizobium albiziae]SFK87018.1 Alkylated DNA repair dioxygenase AlkB [Mesorhizobium albiziae]
MMTSTPALKSRNQLAEMALVSGEVQRAMPDQLSLFVDKVAQPSGFSFEPDFVSADEERALIGRLGDLPLTPFQFGAFEGKRRIASFGWRYDYSMQKLQQASPMPDWLIPFAHRVESSFQLASGAIQQILCTEYDEGVGIGWHRDKPHFDEVFGLSLASACKFRFRRKVDDVWQRLTFDIEPRSLYRLSGAARNVWEHSIAPVAARRYSVTFRTMAIAAGKGWGLKR